MVATQHVLDEVVAEFEASCAGRLQMLATGRRSPPWRGPDLILEWFAMGGKKLCAEFDD